MATKWVKVLKPISRNVIGGYKNYRPGDWFEADNQEIRSLLAQRVIEVPKRVAQDAFALDDIGVLLQDDGLALATRILDDAGLGQICLKTGAPALPYGRTLIWDSAAHLRPDLITVGFHRLAGGWQIAAPLWKYQELARDLGTPEERARTEEVIHDLRVLVYDHRALFVRRCPDTERWLDAYREELVGSSDGRLALMRALYRTKPVVCALPTTWVGK